jgi:hypothetical protein
MHTSTKYPEPFLEVRIEVNHLTPPFTTLCAGCEGGTWRAQGPADHDPGVKDGLSSRSPGMNLTITLKPRA